MHVKTHFRV